VPSCDDCDVLGNETLTWDALPNEGEGWQLAHYSIRRVTDAGEVECDTALAPPYQWAGSACDRVNDGSPVVVRAVSRAGLMSDRPSEEVGFLPIACIYTDICESFTVCGQWEEPCYVGAPCRMHDLECRR